MAVSTRAAHATRRAAEGWHDADAGSPEVAAIDELLERGGPVH